MNENTSTNQINENNGGPSHSNLNGGLDLSNHKTPSTSEEKPLENVQQNNTTKRASTSSSASKGKKRKKCLRDAAAPKQPLTGYFRFLNDRREKIRTENPTLPFSEITRQLAAEWNMLPQDQKQQYLDAAEQDKERYTREFNEYKQTEAYRLFLEKQKQAQKNEKKEKNIKNGKNEKHTYSEKNEKPNDLRKEKNGTNTSAITTENNESRQGSSNENTIHDIPIFTEEFLEHNKVCEAQLRQLRKSTTDYESQNAVLERHIDSLKTAVERLQSETNHQAENNQALQSHLDTLRFQLASSFANIPLPGLYDGATLENIDAYIEKLESLMNSNMESTLRTTLRDAVSHLDLIK